MESWRYDTATARQIEQRMRKPRKRSLPAQTFGAEHVFTAPEPMLMPPVVASATPIPFAMMHAPLVRGGSKAASGTASVGVSATQRRELRFARAYLHICDI